MDCNMPVMDGYEATDKIRSFLFENKIEQPLIIAVTGHSEKHYVGRAINAGMNQVFSKPVRG
jgi:CheY-like chemotaxis protein